MAWRGGSVQTQTIDRTAVGIDVETDITALVAAHPATARIQIRKLHAALRRVGWCLMDAQPDVWRMQRRDGTKMELARHLSGRGWYVMVSIPWGVRQEFNPFQRRSTQGSGTMVQQYMPHLLRGSEGQAVLPALEAIALCSAYAADNPAQRLIDG
jgi:hypothetical protein